MILAGRGEGEGAALHGALIRTGLDHRIAMSFAVAALVAEGECSLDDEACVRISYPAFFQDLSSLLSSL